MTVHAPGYTDVRQSIDLLTASSDFVYIYISREPEDKAPLRVGYIDAHVPEQAQKEYEKGQVALAEHNKREIALRHFENATNLYSNFFEAELALGTLYMDLGQWENAERALRRAIEINPRVPNALLALGELKLQHKLYSEAEQVLIDGLKLDNRSWRGHFALGTLSGY